MLKKFLNKILDFILPKEQAVAELEKMGAEEFQARNARCDRTIFPWATAYFNYKDVWTRKAIWEMKYRGNKQIIALLAEILAGEMAEELSDLSAFENFREPILLPIPISAERRRERGWNQCELLAEKISEISGGGFFELRKDLLLKSKNTQSQTKAADRKARLQNLRGSFAAASPEKIRGRNVILLDDVITTGATLEEARRALLNAGARKVIAFAVAH